FKRRRTDHQSVWSIGGSLSLRAHVPGGSGREAHPQLWQRHLASRRAGKAGVCIAAATGARQAFYYDQPDSERQDVGRTYLAEACEDGYGEVRGADGGPARAVAPPVPAVGERALIFLRNISKSK